MPSSELRTCSAAWFDHQSWHLSGSPRSIGHRFPRQDRHAYLWHSCGGRDALCAWHIRIHSAGSGSSSGEEFRTSSRPGHRPLCRSERYSGRNTRILRVFANYPGRLSAALRLTLACVVSLFLVVLFRLPGATLGAFFPFLLARDGLRNTFRSILLMAAMAVLATADTIGGAMLFARMPLIHFRWITLNLLLVFFSLVHADRPRRLSVSG